MSEFCKELLSKVRHYAIITFLAAVPAFFYPDVSQRDAQEMFFQFASICLISIFIGNIWISAFVIWNVILFHLAGGEVGISQIINVFLGALLFMISRWYFQRNKIQDYFKPLLWVAFASMVFMIFQICKVDPIFSGSVPGKIAAVNPHGFSDPVGIFGIKMANGIFMTLMMPIMAFFNPILALFLIVPIALSQSSSVMISVASVTLFYIWHLHRTITAFGRRIPLFLISAIICLSGAAFYVAKDVHDDPRTAMSRFPSWSMVISASKLHPITGFGPDSFRNINKLKNFTFHNDNLYRPLIVSYREGQMYAAKFYSPTQNESEVQKYMNEVEKNGGFPAGLPKNGSGEVEFNLWDNPHNLLLTIYFQYGIVGLVIFFGFIRQMYFRFRWAMCDKELVVLASLILVYLISSFTHFPVELARLGYFLPILLGAYFAKTEKA